MPATVPIGMLIAGEVRVGLRPEIPTLRGTDAAFLALSDRWAPPGTTTRQCKNIGSSQRNAGKSRARSQREISGPTFGQGANLGPYSRAGRTRRARGMFQRGPCSLLVGFRLGIRADQDFNALPSAVRWRALAGLPSGPTVQPFLRGLFGRWAKASFPRAGTRSQGGDTLPIYASQLGSYEVTRTPPCEPGRGSGNSCKPSRGEVSGRGSSARATGCRGIGSYSRRQLFAKAVIALSRVAA
jgi:hypothetical protein